MSRWNLILPVLISSVVGVVAAIVTVGVISGNMDVPEAVAAPKNGQAAEASSRQRTRTVVVQSDSAKLRELEERIDELSENDEGDREEINAPPDMEGRLRQFKETVAEMESSYEHEPFDPAWSPQAQQDLTTGLGGLGEELGFSLQTAECRSNSCKAVVRWNDLDKAERNGAQLAGRTFPGLNCMQTVFLKNPTEPDDSNISDTATLYLDCSEQRAGSVEVMR